MAQLIFTPLRISKSKSSAQNDAESPKRGFIRFLGKSGKEIKRVKAALQPLRIAFHSCAVETKSRTMSMAQSDIIRWLPLESNPETINTFLKKMGVKNEYEFVDVLGFDSDLLALIPRPVIALLLLFPCSEEKLKATFPDDLKTSTSEKQPYFIVQTIRNACGTIALIHAIANNTDCLQFEENSVLKNFIQKTADLTPEDRSKLLENSADIGEAHDQYARKGQTSAPDLNQDVDFHFIALVEHNNKLYELDGRKSCPVCHGSTSKENFLEDAAKVCKQFIQSSNSLKFTAIALAKQES